MATEVWPCNYSNRLDNDPNHIPFVHRESRRRANLATVLPSIVVEETEYGIKSTRKSAGGKIHVTYKLWPNGAHHASALRTKIPLDNSPSAGGWMARRLWRVPFDDENCISFGVNLVHVTGDAAKMYLERREQTQRQYAETSPLELGQAVIAGKLRIEDLTDVPISKLTLVEDFVSQVGQGRIPDYENEIMGRGDSGVFLRRKIWEREVKALAEGRPLKKWTSPPQLSAMNWSGA